MALPPRLARYSRLIDLLVEELVREADQGVVTAPPGKPTPRAMRRNSPTSANRWRCNARQARSAAIGAEAGPRLDRVTE
jgi:hypothetical protein